MKTRPTIVVADDFAPFLQKLVALLDAQFDIVARTECGREALEAIHRYEPDGAVIDLTMPDINGIEVIRALAKHPRSPFVVICSVETDPDVVQAVRQTGAVAYVTKSRLVEDLIPALNLAVRGQGFVSPL